MGYKNCRLTIIKGFNKGQVYPLDIDEVIIGRGEENGITLNIAEVSRTHAVLNRTEEGYVIKDLGSTNGTFVDKKKVGEKYLLKPGDTVMLGDAIYLTYQADTDPEETLIAPRPEEFSTPEVTAVTPKPPAKNNSYSSSNNSTEAEICRTSIIAGSSYRREEKPDLVMGWHRLCGCNLFLDRDWVNHL